MGTFRSFRWVGVVALFASVFVGGAGVTTQVANAATVPVCTTQHFVGSGTLSTRPGGTTVRLVLTSKYFPTCSWSNLTSFQFLTAGGLGIGTPISYVAPTPTVTLPPTPWTVGDTFQIIQNLTTEEGVQCTQKVAAYVAVAGPSGGTLRIKLPQTVGVCVSGSTRWTSLQSLSFPRSSRCVASALKISLGQSNGTAGTIYYPLVFANISSKACTISGVPSVQPTTGALPGVAHILIGPRSAATNYSAAGYGDAIRLAPGASASAALGVTDTGNFTPSACVAKKFESLSVGLAGIGEYWLGLSSTTCTKRVSTNVRGVVPTANGLAP
jgi:hypothetical protein